MCRPAALPTTFPFFEQRVGWRVRRRQPNFGSEYLLPTQTGST
jgi:hypothetical protein